MATTQAVTGMVVNSVRRNDDGTVYLIVTITYTDATTDVLELPVSRLVP